MLTRGWKQDRADRRDTVSRAGSGVCELTNQSRLGITEEGLKETVAKTECFRQSCCMRRRSKTLGCINKLADFVTLWSCRKTAGFEPEEIHKCAETDFDKHWSAVHRIPVSSHSLPPPSARLFFFCNVEFPQLLQLTRRQRLGGEKCLFLFSLHNDRYATFIFAGARWQTG